MNWRRILLIVIVLIVIAGGALFFLQRSTESDEQTPEIEAVDVNTVTADTGLDTVFAEGEVVPLRSAELSVPLSGQVAELLVTEGDQVSEGDPILRLDSTDQEITLDQARAGLAQAEANLESAKAGLAAANSARRLAELDVSAAEAQLALVEAGPTTQQIRVAERGVDAAEAGISAASGNQALTIEGAPAAQILAAEAQLRAAQTAEKQLRDAVNDTSGEEKRRLEDQLIAAVAIVNAAEAALEETRAGATSAERFAASSAVSQAASQRDAAEAQLALLLEGAREEQVDVARVGVQQAEARMAEADLAVSRAETAVAAAKAGVQQAHAAIDAAQKALDLMTLNAPFAGTIAELAVELGEVASPGRPTVTLADFDGWLVETTDLTEFGVVSLAIGSPVEVALDAFPDETLSGTVSDIARIGQYENQFEQKGDILYLVTVELDDEGDLPLRWGMTATVDIDVGQ